VSIGSVRLASGRVDRSRVWRRLAGTSWRRRGSESSGQKAETGGTIGAWLDVTGVDRGAWADLLNAIRKRRSEGNGGVEPVEPAEHEWDLIVSAAAALGFQIGFEAGGLAG
jgi:hypothetical protein